MLVEDVLLSDTCAATKVLLQVYLHVPRSSQETTDSENMGLSWKDSVHRYLLWVIGCQMSDLLPLL